MVSSLDGIIAKRDNSVSWFDSTDHYENGVTEENVVGFMKTIDCFIMGARTYLHAEELSVSYGWAYGDVPTVVVSDRALQVERSNVKVFTGEMKDLANDLKSRYRSIWLVGGASLAQTFLRLKLVDEIRLSILPVILGDGIRLFSEVMDELSLHLKDTTAYKTGMVELCYECHKS